MQGIADREFRSGDQSVCDWPMAEEATKLHARRELLENGRLNCMLGGDRGAVLAEFVLQCEV
jgi:hypothetical protein